MRFTILVILIVSVLGLMFDTLFVQLKPAIPFLLSAIMFFMGISLSFHDFKRVFRQWQLILLGTSLQFFIMPVLALLISRMFSLSPAVTLGMVLVGACPGGTASNVIVFLGKGNVPLSVSLTLVSTLLSPMLTPLILQVTLSEHIHFHFTEIVFSITQIVIVPIVFGLLIHYFFSNVASFISVWSSGISGVGIAFIIACVLALNKAALATFPLIVIVAVVLHNGFGFLLGYYGARFFQSTEKDARTIAIEVGMQNSGLAVSLAQQFFGNIPLTALPGAVFSFWHNLAGVGFVYLKKPVKQ